MFGVFQKGNEKERNFVEIIYFLQWDIFSPIYWYKFAHFLKSLNFKNFWNLYVCDENAAW